ncbi:DAK2 domain-containing protein [Micromonospora echinofusca]|uniref:DAK2 domain-containing protein n=1 Tax=Micromonospora echinofusca TaxID=47858 RepID=A0ABS3W191_MICEH|nr:DAK2 domain-containing protein [Micromonospora echinofusca]MBO4210491.1 DAK2 domain-containing protein [Micromonospora echinofusca]
MLETLDAAAVRRWCAGGLAALKRHQSEIDDLNVYPVPDGDTGTNLVLTLTSAQQALALDLDNAPEGPTPPHGHALRLMARGALLGARGNSGVIMSQILRGLADTLAAVETVRGRALADGLRAAARAAWSAVAHPVEGTLLTVVRAAADAAGATAGDDLPAVARAAAAGATAALAHTPEQLPALARAGVVDAGGQGLCVLLDALVEVITGERPAAAGPGPVRRPVTVVRETGSEEYAYEVQFLLDAEPAAVRRLREVLDSLGDSLVVVGDGATPEESSTWNVHVHVNDVGAAVEAGVTAGRPYQISVTRFADQPPPDRPVAPDPAARAAVVVAPGAGIAELFAREGATVVPGNPSTGELLDAVRATGAARVVVLPNDPNTQAVAGAAAREAHLSGIRVSVVPTRSPVQALAALAVRDPGRRFEDDVIAMAEAAGACRYAEVCQASREAVTVAGPCRPGDVLALVEGEVHLIGTDLVDTATALLDRMLGGGGELVTLLYGADAPDGLAEALQTHVTRRWPFVEVQGFPGGQPHYPLLVGVE